MTINDLKIYGFNSLTFAISFSNVEATLKIILFMCFYCIYYYENN